MHRDPSRVAVIGYGAMARSLIASLLGNAGSVKIGAVLLHPGATAITARGLEVFNNVGDLLAWRPSLVVECASHQAVRESVSPFLAAGIDTVIASIGSLSDAGLRERLEAAARSGGSRLVVASGAIGGLDVLRAAKIAGLDEVTYTGVKPPAAWKGTPAEQAFDLDALDRPTVIFGGNAAEASILFPKNANVTAAVALAGIGFAETSVTLVADPDASGNSHRVSAKGAFGNVEITLNNKPLPDNPKTSWLAALSIEQTLVRQFAHLES